MEAFTDDRTANRQKAAYELEAPDRLDSGGSLCDSVAALPALLASPAVAETAGPFHSRPREQFSRSSSVSREIIRRGWD